MVTVNGDVGVCVRCLNCGEVVSKTINWFHSHPVFECPECRHRVEVRWILEGFEHLDEEAAAATSGSTTVRS